MKRRDFAQLKTKPTAELQKMVAEAREKLRKLRFDLAAGKVKNVAELRSTRKGIARMATLLREQADAVLSTTTK
ncbi:MAG: 50S ribosomal protein L29 [Candidatus Liptonbacteria bacterium]|nr:50S ribosomal protein L29 [Candidatus Liptonbacteria bacterium]